MTDMAVSLATDCQANGPDGGCDKDLGTYTNGNQEENKPVTVSPVGF